MKYTLKLLGFAAVLVVSVAMSACAGSASAATAPAQPSVEATEAATATAEATAAQPAATIEPEATVEATSAVSVGSDVSVGPNVTGLPATDATPDGGDQSNDVVNITMDDNGKTVTLHVGQEFLLFLEKGNQPPQRLWSLDMANQDVFSRVMGIMVIQGAQGLFKVNQPGTASLSAVGDMLCRQDNPPCMTPSLSFQVTIEAK